MHQTTRASRCRHERKASAQKKTTAPSRLGTVALVTASALEHQADADRNHLQLRIGAIVREVVAVEEHVVVARLDERRDARQVELETRAAVQSELRDAVRIEIG